MSNDAAGRPVARASPSHLDVRETMLVSIRPRARNLLAAALDADDTALRANAPREQLEAAARSAAHLDDAPAVAHTDLVEEALRVERELVGLALEPLLLRLPIAEQIGIRFAHLTLQVQHARRHSSSIV
jgi:hypothetical protein